MPDHIPTLNRDYNHEGYEATRGLTASLFAVDLEVFSTRRQLKCKNGGIKLQMIVYIFVKLKTVMCILDMKLQELQYLRLLLDILS